MRAGASDVEFLEESEYPIEIRTPETIVYKSEGGIFSGHGIGVRMVRTQVFQIMVRFWCCLPVTY